MSIEGEISQSQYLNMGGSFARAIAQKRKIGELADVYTYREYPKMLRISEGVQDVECSTETIRGTMREWTEKREVFTTIVVHSEDEEERVLSGGKTSAQIEDERQGLILRCRALGLKVDPAWSAVRLRRELGDKLDAPEPENKMVALESELANLRKMAEMQAEIDRLKAQMAAPAEVDDMRQQLTELGVTIDKRWGASRLREELEAATAPKAA